MGLTFQNFNNIIENFFFAAITVNMSYGPETYKISYNFFNIGFIPAKNFFYRFLIHIFIASCKWTATVFTCGIFNKLWAPKRYIATIAISPQSNSFSGELFINIYYNNDGFSFYIV